MQKYRDSHAASYLCYTKTTNDGEPSAGLTVIFRYMKKGRRPSDYFSLTRQPLFVVFNIIKGINNNIMIVI